MSGEGGFALKLFDETHEYGEADFRRTIWYRFGETDDNVHYIFSGPIPEHGGRMVTVADYSVFAGYLKELIAVDLSAPAETAPTETHWVFYTDIIDGDAISDEVRFTVYVRFKSGRFECNINMSDFIFASSFDNVLAVKALLTECLNCSELT